MGSYEHTVEIDRPVRYVYDQWTQFESYPQFMDDVEWVRQTADDMTRWRVSIGGITREYDARILEQHPDEVISWMSIEGPEQGGTVTFVPLDMARTRVTLRMDFDPHGFAEKAGDSLGFVESSVKKSAEEFKRFMESREAPTGGWRGEIVEGRTAGMSPAAERSTSGLGLTDPAGSGTDTDPQVDLRGMPTDTGRRTT